MAKQPGRKILRVGLFQNQRLLEERLMRKPETVTIGHDYHKNTLVVPASRLPRTFAIFEQEGDGYVLQFTEQMGGKVSRGQGVETLEDLRRKGVAKKKGGVYRLPLTPQMRGRVVVGEATVVFQFVTPPPQRPKPVLPASMRGGLIHGMDRPLALLILLSALIQVGFVVFLELQDWPVVEDQEFRIPDRMARIMVDEPEEEPEPEIVDDGEGPDETQPDETEPAPVEEPTPEEVAEQRHEERLSTTEQVRDTTQINTLAAAMDEGGDIRNMLDSYREMDIDSRFAEGSRVEVDSGAGGDHFGGRGDPDATGGGLAEGEELGALDGASQDVDTGRREETQVERVPVQMGVDEPEDMIGGTLDTAAVQRGLRQLQSAIQACYRDYLRTNPSASGTVRVLITITARGNRGVISSADVAGDEVGGRVGQCVANQLRAGRARLPAPEDGDVQITVPFHFSPGG